MDVSVLIPWRPDGGQRDDVFRYLVPLWRATGAQICIGTDTGSGPFNAAMAQNNAFRQAENDVLVMYGADQLPDPLALETALAALSGGRNAWLPLYSQTGYYSEETTREILAGTRPEGFELDYTLPFCTGVLGLTRDAYVATGGQDERFSGWGYEDAAFRQTLAGLFGVPDPLPLTLRCLWHAGDHRIAVSPNEVLMRDYTPLQDPAQTRAYLDARGSFLA